MNSIISGQMAEARDLGIDPIEVGCGVGCGCRPSVSGIMPGTGPCTIGGDFWESVATEEQELAEIGFSFPNPIKAVSNITKGVTRAVKSVPVLGAPFKAADAVLHSGPMNTLQKVLSNPFVSTVMGNNAILGSLLLATTKEGPQGALRVAKQELNNPVRQAAIKAIAVVFPPAAPAAVAYEAARRVVDAVKSKDPVAATKAVAQIAATTALAQTGNPDAIRGLELLNKAKAIADKIPVNPMTLLSHGRIEVCGAKSEENRGIWLKSHVYRDGNFLRATVYSVANANAEVFNLRVDLRPLMKAATAYHKQMHGGNVQVGGFFDNIQKTALKLGRAKLAQQAFAVSSNLAKKTACNVQTPNVPVSDVALTVYAAARTGVDAVDKNAKLKTAMEGVASNIHRLIQVKNHLKGMTPQQRAVAVQDPTIRSAVLKGIGSKFALANFIKQGGPEKAKQIRRNAMIASRQFSKLAAGVKAGDPNAKKMAKVVSIAAKTRAKTQQTVQNNAGGTAGMVIDSKGKVRKAFKGFHKRTPRAGEQAQVLIPRRGAPQTGVFTAISGSAYNTRLQNRLKKIRHLAVISGVDPAELIGALNWKGGMKNRQRRLHKIDVLNANIRDDASSIVKEAMHIARNSKQIGDFANVDEKQRVSGATLIEGAALIGACLPLGSGVRASAKRLRVGVVDSDGPVDYESGVPYDAFVQDPFREDQLPADLAL